MGEVSHNYLQHLQVRLGEVAFELGRLRIVALPAGGAWCPAVNAYECDDELVICVDLAGVDQTDIVLQVERFRVLLRGHRKCPEPAGMPERPLRIVALEIDHGPFEREIALPVEVDPEQVRAEQRCGILWIHLPVSRPDLPPRRVAVP